VVIFPALATVAASVLIVPTIAVAAAATNLFLSCLRRTDEPNLHETEE
jgi:hypothetical protein